MKYIKEQKTRRERIEAENDVYIKQSNIMIDSIVKSRTYVNNRIKEVFNIDVNDNFLTTPFPCAVAIFTSGENDMQESESFDVSDSKKESDLRSYGRFLKNVTGECEVDFIMVYTLYFPTGFNFLKKKRTVDNVLTKYEKHADKVIEIVKLMRIFKEDLGDMKVFKIREIRDEDEDGEYSVVFEIRRKNRITIDPLRWIKKINT
jgi:hypothetical protein